MVRLPGIYLSDEIYVTTKTCVLMFIAAFSGIAAKDQKFPIISEQLMKL